MALPPVLAPVYRSVDLRAIEESARALPLMERAGLAAAEVARAMAGDRGGKVLLLAGPGNNGGDALVVARWLRQWYFDTTVVFRADPAKLPRDASAAHRAFVAAGGTTLAFIFSGRRRHTISTRDWSSDVCSSDLRRRTPPATRTGRVRPGAPGRGSAPP